MRSFVVRVRRLLLVNWRRDDERLDRQTEGIRCTPRPYTKVYGLMVQKKFSD